MLWDLTRSIKTAAYHLELYRTWKLKSCHKTFLSISIRCSTLGAPASLDYLRLIDCSSFSSNRLEKYNPSISTNRPWQQLTDVNKSWKPVKNVFRQFLCKFSKRDIKVKRGNMSGAKWEEYLPTHSKTRISLKRLLLLIPNASDCNKPSGRNDPHSSDSSGLENSCSHYSKVDPRSLSKCV